MHTSSTTRTLQVFGAIIILIAGIYVIVDMANSWKVKANVAEGLVSDLSACLKDTAPRKSFVGYDDKEVNLPATRTLEECNRMVEIANGVIVK